MHSADVPGTHWQGVAPQWGSPLGCGDRQHGGRREARGDTSAAARGGGTRETRGMGRGSVRAAAAADLLPVHSERGRRWPWTPPWRPRRHVVHGAAEVNWKMLLAMGGAMLTWTTHWEQHACMCMRSCVSVWTVKASMHAITDISPCPHLRALQRVPIRVPEKQRRPSRGTAGEWHPCCSERLGQGVTRSHSKARVAVPPAVAGPQR